MKKFLNFSPISYCIIGILLSSFISFLIAIFILRHPFSIDKNNQAAVVRLLEEVWNKGNFQVVDQIIAPHYTIRYDPGDQWEGKTLNLSTYIKRVKFSHHAFPDQKFYIKDILSQNEKVSVSWVFTGTQKGEIPGLPITNKKVKVSGVTIYYFNNGKIIGHWQEIDRLGFLLQLDMRLEAPKTH